MLSGAVAGELSWQHDARCVDSPQQLLLPALRSSAPCHAIQRAWGSSGEAPRYMNLQTNREMYFLSANPVTSASLLVSHSSVV